MGQRIIIAVEIKYNSKIYRRGYHMQWGYGKIGVRACAGLLLSKSLERAFNKYADEPEVALDRLNLYDFSSAYFSQKELDQMLTPEGEIDMEQVIHNHDNNNGGILLKVNFDKYGLADSGEISFYRGDEDITDPETQGRGDKMTLTDYLEQYGGDLYFAPMFEQIFDYCNIKCER